MSTSEWSYIVAVNPTVQWQAAEPLDALSARVLLSNVCHYSDEAAQVRVAWSGSCAGTAGGGFTNIQLMSWQFPILQRQSGDSYRFRIRIGGYATGGAGVTFRAVIGRPGASGGRTSWAGVGDRSFLTASASGSAAWITGASEGANAWSDMIYLPSALVETTLFTTSNVIGGAPTTVEVPWTQLSVYGTSDKGATDPPILSGVYLAEYVG